MREVLPSLILLLAVGTVGCYNHRVVPLDEVRAGSEVRVRVSTDEAERLEREAQVPDRVFRAEVLEAEPDALLLQLPVPGSGLNGSEPIYNRVRIPSGEMLEVEVRELSKPKTFGLIGVGVAAVAYATLRAFESTDDPDTEGKEPGEPTRARVRIPLLGWRW
ncbi:MAG: hypothetical protein PVI57_07850 [Gemmatimonadota bacterium]|jgi:hypothetical protein